jgi:type II secretory pathway component PulJ
MIVVVAIFALLAGGIYATVNAAIRATATVSEENLEVQRLDAFIALLRRTLHNLPATAQVRGGVRSEDGEGFSELILRDSPGAFDWGSDVPSEAFVLLKARPRLGGGVEIALQQIPANLDSNELRDRIVNGDWLRLLPDLRSVRWKAHEASAQQLPAVGEAAQGAMRPTLLELSLEFLGDPALRRYVFWLPPLSKNPPVAASRRPETNERNPQEEGGPNE